MAVMDYQEYLGTFIQKTFIPTHYSINVTNPGGLLEPQNGFIDDLHVREYAKDPSDPTAHFRATGLFPTSKELSIAKTRGRIRWEQILINISNTTSPVLQLNVDADGADHDTEATNMVFVLKYERPEFLATEDELNPGTVLTEEDAIKRFIARALILGIDKQRDIYNPESAGNKSGPQTQGPIIERFTIGPIFTDITTAEGNISVIKSDLST